MCQANRLILLVTVAALFASACSSTARIGQQRAADGVSESAASSDGGGALPDDHSGQWLGAQPPQEGDGRQEGIDGPAQAPDRRAAGGSGGQAIVPDTGHSVEGTGASPRGEGRGFTATQIMIGTILSRDAGAANRAIGAETEPGDPRYYLEVLVDELNRRGGVAGREVVPVVHEIDETSAETFEQQYQAACARWTQDEPVFAVALTGSGFLQDSVRACLDQRAVPLWIGASSSSTDAEVFERFGFYVETASLHLGRLSRTLAIDLGEQGYFNSPDLVGEAQVGVLRYDRSSYQRAVEQELRPALASIGVEIAEEVAVTEPQRVSDVGAASAQVANAVLRFRARGITHVLFIEPSGLLAFLFMNQAEGQGYRPRYGLHSGNGGQGLPGNVPIEQLHGAVGIGHVPLFDVPPDRVPATPGRQRCRDIMQRGGAEFPSADAEHGALSLCDVFFLMQESARDAGEPLRSEGLMSGLAAVGRSFPAATTRGVFFSAQRRDGAAAYQRVAFSEQCTCFEYTSEPLPAR